MKKITANIIDFGAVSDIKELQTEKIQAAIDFCFRHGGGEVLIPEGKFYTGDIRLRSNITLHLLSGAELLGSMNPEDYFHYLDDKLEPLRNEQITNAGFINYSKIMGQTEYIKNNPEFMCITLAGSRWNNAIVRAIDADNVKIIGEKSSIIDGRNCFDECGEESYRGPHAITFFNCSNIEFRGYTVQNSANWAHNIHGCKNILFDKVTVLAGHDGAHFSSCTNIEAKNCEFYTGDDCFAGFANVNVHLLDSILNSSCSAMRFGGSNVLVERCHIYGPGKYYFRGTLTDEEKRNSAPVSMSVKRNNMLSAFTYYADYSLEIPVKPGNIVITDCKIEMADRFLHYNYSGNELWQKGSPLNNIEFTDIEAKDVSMPLTAYGSADKKIDLKLENVKLSMRKGSEKISLIHICNFNNLVLKNVCVDNFEGDCLVKKWSEGNIQMENVVCGLVKHKAETSDEPFFAKPI